VLVLRRSSIHHHIHHPPPNTIAAKVDGKQHLLSSFLTKSKEGNGLTIEKLLSLLVYEWRSYLGRRTSPMGSPLGGVETCGNETSIALAPLTMDIDGH
jgi:hypothetical protein